MPAFRPSWIAIIVSCQCPLCVSKQIDKLRRDFLWDSNSKINTNKMHLVNWQAICRPKKEGRWGIISVREHARCQHIKFIWKLNNSSNPIWKEIIIFKYYKNKCTWCKPNRSSCLSPVWKNICRFVSIFKQIILLILVMGTWCIFGKTRGFNIVH